MNIRILPLLGLALSFVSPLLAVTVGSKAPDFTLTDHLGKTHSLADFKGKVVVLEWVNPECPFVVKHYDSGNMPKLQKSAASEGVVWLAINSGRQGAQGDYSPEQVNKWMSSTGAAPTAYLRDPSGDVGRSFNAKTTPHMFVIDAEGKVAYAGAIDSIRSAKQDDIPKAENYLVAALSAVKQGKTVERASTQPYGCGVKY